MDDTWFFKQYEAKPGEAAPSVAPTSRQRTVTLSVRNHTYLRWKVALHGSKTTDARATALNFRPLDVPPNDSASGTLIRLIQNESLRVNRIEVSSDLSSQATLTLADEQQRHHAWRALAGHTDLSLCIEWSGSDVMEGHAVPTLRVETIRLQQG